MYTALVASSQTIRDFLTTRLRQDPGLAPFFDPALGGSMIVSLNTPDEMIKLNKQGVSLWLYRVVRDENLLNDPPRRVNKLQYRQTPLPVRLHYLVTPLVARNQAAGAELEQRVLGKVLQVFHDHAKLRGPDLHGDLSGRSDVELFLRLEPLTLDEITKVWYSLKESYQLSVSYEVSVVTVDSEKLDDLVPVDTVVPHSGIIVAREEAAV
jgi:hypothetical protein